MNRFKMFGIVVAAHVVGFLFIFAIPGCRSSGKPAASGADAPAPSPVASTGDNNASPVSASAVVLPSDSPVSSAPLAPTLSSPTRPGTAEAGLLATQPLAPIAAQPMSAYTVVKGDNLWSIAKKNGISTKDLAAANNIKTTAPLRLGQHLVIPGKSEASTSSAPAAAAAESHTYTIKSGDTLAAVARHAGTTKAELRKLNKLKSDNLHVGQVLMIPSATPHAAVHSSHSTGAVASEKQGTEVGASDYVVKAGDSLGGIAHKFHVKVGDIAAANNISDPAKLRVGQKLKIPGGRAATAPKASTSSSSSATPAASAAPESASPVSDAPLFSSPVAPASPAAPASSPLFTPVPAPSAPAASPVDASTAGAPVVPVTDSPAAQ